MSEFTENTQPNFMERKKTLRHKITHVVGQKECQPPLISRWILGLKARLGGNSAYKVPNQSMLSTLHIRELVQLDRSAYATARPCRGDVIVYVSKKHDKLPLPSRIVGLEYETVELREGRLLVDRIHIVEPYVDSDSNNDEYSRTYAATMVPANHVFLMGDFRDLSEDSRILGPVHQDLVIGRIVL